MRPQELNLLMVFDAIMTEQSITRAADRLSMTQPAVSNAVSRMRTAWQDELFVKDGRNIRPTVYAQNLWDQIRRPLIELSDAVDSKSFEPATAKRTFKVALPDIVVDMVWTKMRSVIETEAPGVNLHAIPYTIVNAEQLLDDADVDMVVGALDLTPGQYRTEYLFSPYYILVMRHGHPLANSPVTLEQFVEADHLLVSLSGDPHGDTDQALMELGLTRRVAMTVNNFSSVIKLVKHSNLISVVPFTAVSDAVMAREVAVTTPPVECMPKQASIIWHKRQDQDPGLQWLRGHFKRIITAEVNRQNNSVMNCMCPEAKADYATKHKFDRALCM